MRFRSHLFYLLCVECVELEFFLPKEDFMSDVAPEKAALRWR